LHQKWQASCIHEAEEVPVRNAPCLLEVLERPIWRLAGVGIRVERIRQMCRQQVDTRKSVHYSVARRWSKNLACRTRGCDHDYQPTQWTLW
jgi:hypothetical protein